MRTLCIAGVFVSVAAGGLGGCTHLKFSDDRRADGITFYDPQPVAIMTQTKDCKINVEIKVMPGKERSVKPVAGITGGKLSATFEDGMLKVFGQDVEGGAAAMKTITGALTEAGILGIEPPGERSGTTPVAQSCKPEVVIQKIDWRNQNRLVFQPPGD